MKNIGSIVAAVVVLALGAVGLKYLASVGKGEAPKAAEAAPSNPTTFTPSERQWANLSVQKVSEGTFRRAIATDGKIAIDEDRTTPVFSPYSGVIKRLAVAPGDGIKDGQLLFTIEATDMVQAENDFITAEDALKAAEAQLVNYKSIEARQHALFEAKATAQKDWQQAQSDLITAENARKTAEIGLEAVRNRLQILKKTDAEIAEFEKTGKINPETPIYSPISGTIVQRKVGPGQYITSGASDPNGDPVFVIGDLTTVWLVANVREAESLGIKVGQDAEFRVLAAPDRVFPAKINYVGSVMDANTRRLMVRATVQNTDKVLKPEMFARVTIFTSDAQASPAVPREAVIYEGDSARVWALGKDKSLALKPIKLGTANDKVIQVLDGLTTDDSVVTNGTLFVDRAASGENG